MAASRIYSHQLFERCANESSTNSCVLARGGTADDFETSAVS